MTRTGTMGALLLAAFTGGGVFGQVAPPAPPGSSQTATVAATPLAFDTVSVKPAPPGTFPLVPAFIRNKGATIVGLQTMAAPVWMTVAYAYHMQMSEALAAFRKQPDWVRTQVYTETFRAEGEPTNEQVREMMRTMLTERFGLQIHEVTREGTVNKLVMSKPGVLGPNIKPHPEGASCSTQEGASVGNAPDASTPPVAYCGLTYYHLPGMVLHVGLTNTTLVDAARSLAGIGVAELDSRPIIDGTGLTGKYDLTIEFRPDSGSPFVDPEGADDGAPTFMRALEQQLGMRVETGQGPVRMMIIDHISQPTPD